MIEEINLSQNILDRFEFILNCVKEWINSCDWCWYHKFRDHYIVIVHKRDLLILVDLKTRYFMILIPTFIGPLSGKRLKIEFQNIVSIGKILESEKVEFIENELTLPEYMSIFRVIQFIFVTPENNIDSRYLMNMLTK